jgi:hypothetical protein
MATTINASTSAGLVSTADTSGVLQLQAAGTTVLNAELGKALALQGATSTTGCGIAFPAAQVASTDVNTLDDYEEGTWTPSDQSGAGLTLTFSGTARYTKVGRLVHVQAQITYPSTANGSNALLGGLPFPGAATYYPETVPAIVGGTITSLVLIQVDSSPYTNFQPRQNLNNTTYTNAQMSGATFSMSWCYIAP